MNATSPDRLPSLPRRLKAHAAEVLALPRRLLQSPIVVRDQDEAHEVRIVLKPLGSAEPAERLPGGWFSPVERKVWDALSAGPLRGRELAAASGEEFGGRLRTLLSNLVDRGCIVSGPRGYARAPAE